MAQIDLGKLKFNWRGTFAVSTAYEVDDVVEFGGSTFVCVANVANNNQTDPKASSSFEFMTVGLNFKGTFSSTTSYQKGDVVNYNNGTFVCIFLGGYNQSLVANTPAPDASNKWQTMTPAPSGGILTTSGDMLVRDNDGATDKRLPIGALNSRLTVVDAPNEDIPNENNFIYRPLSKSASATDRVAGLYGDNTVTPNSRTLAVTVAAVSGQNQFHIGGVDRPAIQANIGETITFDVSDSSNTGHVFAFKTWAGGGSSNYVAMYLEAQYGITRSGTPGQSGATITWVVNENCYNPMQYYCSAHSAMGTGVINTASTLNPPKPTAYYNPLTSSGSLKISKGKSYTFTFPADGLTYSIKNPSASGYTGAGSGGRIVDGTAQPQSVTNGGSITYTPAANSSLATVVIRNEANQNDVLTLSLTDPAKEPAWTDTAGQAKNAIVDPSTKQPLPYTYFPNAAVNNATESILPLPAYLKQSGRGPQYGTIGQGYRQGGVITQKGEYFQWGMHRHNNSNGYYYGGGFGGTGTFNGTFNLWIKSQLRMPRYWKQALAGDTTLSKWLTDLNGNDLGYLDANGKPTVTVPKIMQVHKGSARGYYLLENGMVLAAGYGGYGLKGDGTTDTRYYCVPLSWYDASNTQLTGANIPKIKQIYLAEGHVNDSTTYQFYGIVYFLSTEGVLYRMGYNAHGQLGDGTNNNNWFIREMSDSLFNNEKIIYVQGAGYRYQHVMAITETGKLWGWGRNSDGQLGIGNTTDQNQPQQITAVAGSELLNKKVIHILPAQGDDDVGMTHVLTDEGKVYFMGQRETYGIYTGSYTSNSASTNMPVLLTNSSTLWNSDNQKVVYMTGVSGQYATFFLITDGGTTGESQKIYSFGANNKGQQGTNTSTSHGASASNQGNWFGAEIKFRDFGDYDFSTGQNSMPNENENMTLASLLSGANKNKFPIGRIIEILPFGYHDETSTRVMMRDEYGNIFVAGHWSYMLQGELTDDGNHLWVNDSDHTPQFVPTYNQPSLFIAMSHQGAGEGENGWLFVDKHGELYCGGYNGDNQMGHTFNLNGFHKHGYAPVHN